MARHNFGSGEYKYLRYPLPAPVAALRQALYPRLAPLANRWHERLRLEPRFPADLDAYLERCHAAGQQRPTPLILKYERATTTACTRTSTASRSSRCRRRSCSAPRATISPAASSCWSNSGRACSRAPKSCRSSRATRSIFAVNYRPVAGTRGYYRATMRHGVSRVRSGHRFTLGIIFHDAA